MSKQNLKYICYIALGIYIVLCSLPFKVNGTLGISVSGAIVCATIYDRWFWKYIPWEKTPKIYGIYHAECHSTYKKKESYISTVTIRQTHSSISVLETIDDGGTCKSVTATLIPPQKDENWQLCYTYQTNPSMLSTTDDMHWGTTILDIHSNEELIGSYFTGRIEQTKGTMHLTRIYT